MSRKKNQSKSLSSPINHLNNISKKYPNAWKDTDNFRASRGDDIPNWPDWCFLPIAAGYAIASGGFNKLAFGNNDAAIISALAAWRTTKGIYKFDSDVLTSLYNTPIDNFPVDILFRLPEWCVYIETPNIDDENLKGFFVHLEYDVNNHHSELRFLLDYSTKLIPIVMHLDSDNLTECINNTHNYTEKTVSETAPEIEDIFNKIMGNHLNEYMHHLIEPLLSLTLYLCSDEKDIQSSSGDFATPKNPSPKKTKKGERIFQADRDKIWEVGFSLGKNIHTISESTNKNNHHNRPHIRRAHWHSFWTGSHKKGNRKLSIKWLPPIVIGAENAYVETLRKVS